ncbi:uncharacterized protein LOC134207141 [Armigeres subalbatus]|uniref:uncharacterized protein LOC134207141 n=1 Tax=Armigeres subalbatus TaxID=124917 RepID=UPI002ED679A5
MVVSFFTILCYTTPKDTRRTDLSCNVHQGQSEILFRIVPVMLYGPKKAIRTYAFVDDGSELTLIEQSLSDELGVQGPTKSLCLRWTGGTQKLEQRSQQINLQISGVHNSTNVQTCECNREPDDDLHKVVKSYFSLDSLGVVKPDKLLISHQDQRAQALLETKTRYVGGRYESGLLWKYDDVRLPDNRAMALNRWKCLQNRMKKNPVLLEALKAKIDDHVSKGYVRKLSEEELQSPRSRVWYLPIFPVINPNKPTKMRLVWDAAATVHGVSLNTFLLKGPDQLTSLLSVLVQFREFRIAVSGDIREMFHQIRIREEDQHCQRFFWADDDRLSEPSVYVVQVMTFGACCSPSTAQFVKNMNTKQYERTHPEAANAIVKRHYVDDMLVSVESTEEAIQLVRDVKRIHTSAGFEMRNWISNCRKVLDAVSEETTNEKNLDIGEESTSEKVLGMWRDTSKECFTYKIFRR